MFVGNGNNARAMSSLADRPKNFYMVGSMSLGPSLAAGFAVRSSAPVVVVEGDGNALMGLSGFPVAARAVAGKTPFVHVVLDNKVYETTGAQRTLSDGVDFVRVALGAGYRAAREVGTAEELRAAVEEALASGECTFLYVVTGRDTAAQHPRVPYHPRDIRTQFTAHVRDAASRADA
ncbi:thiamine pyrophosphate-dependent enzyme [Deinococcus aerius]|uniref:thiamine pyrophosphate-dependent enzyme n=1 Tax=Deinococcus aerius TaxID=200253 RepID=UPI001056F013|nr:thiamine pyrophosphate-dependent enzyme [Deinococcus aerius]